MAPREFSVHKQQSLADAGALRGRYFESQGRRLETYLEELISFPSSCVYTIGLGGGEVFGYFCVSAEKTLLQFFIDDSHIPHAGDVLAYLIAAGLVERALVLTRDRLALSVCAEFQRQVAVDCYVFEEGPGEVAVSTESPGAELRLATPADVPAIRAACSNFHDFLHYTLEDSIAAAEIFVLQSDGGEVLGTGVIGARDFWPPYVDLGMCVSEAHRRKGIGAHIIRQLRAYCRARSWVPGASCKFGNVASRKTLERAGMISRDRVLEFMF
jgi:GNAT superfamily N-acetyltransferase